MHELPGKLDESVSVLEESLLTADLETVVPSLDSDANDQVQRSWHITVGACMNLGTPLSIRLG